MIAVPIRPGELLNEKYRVDRVLGQGGMGVVVAATHVELDEPVAIKFLQGVPSEATARRFLAEARAAAKIKNEHVCRAFDFGRTPTGEPYIVMELLEGCDLSDELARRGPLAADEVVGWARQACEGLAAAHALGIVHRDVKPENLFLVGAAGSPRKVKVLDFGVSKTPESNVTRSAVSMGSPLYMAPEQMVSSRDVDARADVWSLGATLYELLSGNPPFEAENVFELASLIKDAEAEPLARRRPELPPELCAIVMRCLAKDPSARFGSASELGEALARVHVGAAPASGVAQHAPAAHDVALVKTLEAAGPSRWPPHAALSAAPSAGASPPRRGHWWGLGLLGLGLAGVALVAARPHDTPAPPAPTTGAPSPSPSPSLRALAADDPLPEAGAAAASPPPSASATSGHIAPHIAPRPSQRAPAAPSSQSPHPTAKPPGSATPPPRL